MGFDRDSSKSGVGGFFQIFDWTAKSRKKLFSNKSDLPENSKQGKRRDGNLPTTRVSLIDDDGTGIVTSFKGGSDFSCASSVTDEGGCGSRAPSVVARLMGLDSLPNSNFQEPYSTPYFDTRSLQDSHFHKKNFEYYNDHQILYGGNMLKRADGQSSRSLAEPKPKKTTPSRAIEKFQTEILPPKSAKSIPITQHRLLSPIKSPGFVPSNDVAHIMEAAAKIIEPGPQYPAKSKMPLVGSSSVPLKVQALREKVEATQRATLIGSSSAKVQDLREKVDAAHRTSRLAESSQRPVESNAAKYLKGQSMTKSWNGSVDMSFRPSLDKEEGSSSSKNKGKSISLAIQAKVNVQKREGLNSSSSRGDISERQQSDTKSSPTFRSQQSNQKVLHKKPSTQNPSGVLRQNIQKQNSQVDKDNSLSKPLVSNSQSRKLLSRDASGRQKASSRSSGSSKTGSRKSSLTGDGEDTLYSSAKNFPRKKRSMDADMHFNKNPSNEKSLSTRNQKPVNTNSVTDVYNWADESQRKGMDVVSFTFTAPLTRPLSGSESPGQVGQRNTGFPIENQGKKALVDSDGMKLSSMGYNGISGDALSLLLEEKLRELTFGLESSVRNSAKGGSALSSNSRLENVIPSLDQSDRHLLSKDKFNSQQFDFEFSTTGPSSSESKQNFQGISEMDESSSGHFEAGKFRSFRHPSPVSILEPSFSIESCDSTISDSNSTKGSKLCSSVQAQEQEVNSLSFTELSDSASSTSPPNLARNRATTLIMLDRSKAVSGWELEYVKEILFNVDLMFNDFASGRSRDVISPHLFSLLESRKRPSESSDSGVDSLRRKVLFDCVGECLDLRTKSCVGGGGGYTMWVKGVTMMRRKERLAEEIYKEILGCESLGDSMVDELVNKDMSSQYGKWLDFGVDEFALAVDCEAQIFDSLIDELIADIFPF